MKWKLLVSPKCQQTRSPSPHCPVLLSITWRWKVLISLKDQLFKPSWSTRSENTSPSMTHVKISAVEELYIHDLVHLLFIVKTVSVALCWTSFLDYNHWLCMNRAFTCTVHCSAALHVCWWRNDNSLNVCLQRTLININAILKYANLSRLHIYIAVVCLMNKLKLFSILFERA